MARLKPGPTEPLVLRGALFTLRRKCGKPTCRCVGGDPHESPALSFTAGGRTKTLTLSSDDVEEVAAALARYASARAELDGRAGAGLEVLSSRLAARRAAR